jgi:hypothetical protein
MASFNSATFDYRGNGGRTFSIWDATQQIAEKSRPNESSMLQDIGADVQRLAVVARCTKAELIALYDQVLSSGSLVLAWETHDAFLEGIDGAFLVVSGQDRYEATLHMIRL